ncbi:general secretion pathway protein G [Asticcacaulis biprosthecium C19]|uniref:Type II secretion system core protein G n=1 Tax=Asticcacaulis biprosthecium C19 TaxID=715226 RepID=F4QHZ5_9CAUL|nr:type II secretion system major pseudopilin GspG [Asticcacaulis biprosthecium]EGF92862.1 general secretion pathway protein G [Asticcacaulis biprosthecium C19]
MRTTDQPTIERRDGGYTLTEMLVVIVIIALIAAVLTPSLLGQLARARAKSATLQLDTTAASLTMFKDDIGRFPTPDEGLKVLVEDPGAEGWLGPYLNSTKALNDPWNRPIVYAAAADGTVNVTSLGADGKTGGKGADQDIAVTVR